MIATLLTLLGAIPGLGSLLTKLGLTGAAYAKGRMDQARAEELAAAKAALDAVQSRAESDDRVRDPGVVTELRRRHTRPE